MDKIQKKEILSRLVRRFEQHRDWDESQTKKSLIEPFWELLGWNIRDPDEVVLEKRVEMDAHLRRADYAFAVGGRILFLVEAKPPKRNLTKDREAIFQLKRYVFNTPGVWVGILTDFEEFVPFLVLKKPDFETAGAIRNRLNERFGYGTARAITPARLELIVPPKYAKQKQRFVELVKATYLSETPELTRARILKYVKDLAVSEDKYASEIALEAIGNASMEKLSVLLNSSQERVRFHAGRCMLNLGSDEGLGALIEIALKVPSLTNSAALSSVITPSNTIALRIGSLATLITLPTFLSPNSSE